MESLPGDQAERAQRRGELLDGALAFIADTLRLQHGGRRLTVLHIAVARRAMETAKLLLEHGADVNVFNGVGSIHATPLQLNN